MMMDIHPPFNQWISENPDPGSILIFVILSGLFLLYSALIAASEVAFFSIPAQSWKKYLQQKATKPGSMEKLFKEPELLLANLITSKLITQIGFLVSAMVLCQMLFAQTTLNSLSIIWHLILIGLVLLFFGEILPKKLAAAHALRLAKIMSPLLLLSKSLLYPLLSILVNSTQFIDRKLKNTKTLSLDDLSEAFEASDLQLQEDRKILQGIVKFGNTDVKEIMRPRVDVVTIDIQTRFSDLIQFIMENGYSRLPVVNQTFDSVKGILYIKDILPHLNKKDDFDWTSLMRKAFFVPETKMLDDLLEEFRRDKNHLAIVVDEYGGTSGIISLEDILEEIVGEITDEMDEEEIIYTQLGENQYLFEGKILLNDFYKIVGEDNDYFFEERGEIETLAGLILERIGMIPEQGTILSIRKYQFKVKSVDHRRIKQVEVQIDPGRESEK